MPHWPPSVLLTAPSALLTVEPTLWVRFETSTFGGGGTGTLGGDGSCGFGSDDDEGSKLVFVVPLVEADTFAVDGVKLVCASG